jgi:hypothetical protein
VKGLEVELELEAEAETESAPAPAQQVLGSEDFIVDSARPSGVPSSSRAFDHRRRPRHEYEQWWAEGATRHVKKEIVDLDDE